MKKLLNQFYSSFKITKLFGSQRGATDAYNKASFAFARAYATQLSWQAFPRLILETTGFMIMIAVVLYVVLVYQNSAAVMPIISLYALSFYRFLPSINKIMMNINTLLFSSRAVENIDNFLKQQSEILGGQTMYFKHDIILKNVHFSYNKKRAVLTNVTCKIPKGSCVGFIGASGCGKSTLADIIMGLLWPQSGTILIDNVPLTPANVASWRFMIGYIPQIINLFDGTVLDNVVYGRGVDLDQLKLVLKQAHIYDFLQSKDGVYTALGEGGVRLSGGQRQRIAIARALYGNPRILILDEATSALDTQTEQNIMDEIYNLAKNKTMLIITHRLSTIRHCDIVFDLKKGNIVDVSHQYVNSSQFSFSMSI